MLMRISIDCEPAWLKRIWRSNRVVKLEDGMLFAHEILRH